MWARRLLLSVVLLLFAARKSQTQFSSIRPINPGGPMIPAGGQTTCSEGSVNCSCYDVPDYSTPGKPPICKYAAVSGALMTARSTETVCTYLKCSENVSVTVSIQYFANKIILLQKDNVMDIFESSSFVVPEVDKVGPAFLSLEVVGTSDNIADRKQVIFTTRRTACSCQKSQPMYKPGDTMKVRIVCFDQDMNQVIKNWKTCNFVDPWGRILSITENPIMVNGVYEHTETFSAYALVGPYRISCVDEAGVSDDNYIQVENFVLPRWGANVQCPTTFSVLDKWAAIKGSATYTYQKPVPGTVTGKCCREMPRYGNIGNCFKGIPDLCCNFSTQLDENGNFSQPLDLDTFKLPMSGPNNNINCEIFVKEEGTGEVLTEYCYISITNRLAVLNLDYNAIGQWYNKGPIPFSASLTDEKGGPIPYQNITVSIDGRQVKIVTTNEKGIASCQIDTTKYFNPNITLSASYYNSDMCYGQDYSSQPNPYAETVLYRFYSQSKSYLRVTAPQTEISIPSQVNVKVDYMLTEKGLGKGVNSARFIYYVTAQSKLVKCGSKRISVVKDIKGSFSIPIDINEKCSTGAQVLVVVPLQDDIISDSTRLMVGYGFRNKVTTKFDKPVVEPGAFVDQLVNATPNSYCGASGKDSSFNLIFSYDDFSGQNMYGAVQAYMYQLQFGDINLFEPNPSCVDPNSEIFCEGGSYLPTSSYTDGESYQNFVESTLQCATNLNSRRRKVCGETEFYRTFPIFNAKFAAAPLADMAGGASPVTTKRTDLSSFFGFTTFYTGNNGKARVSTKLPQSITSWLSTVFCVSNKTGIGLTTTPATTTTILPMFVDVQYPPRLYRNETTVVVVTATNNMDRCMQVRGGIEPSQNDSFEVTPLDNKGEQCACPGQVVFWTLSVTCKKLGQLSISAFAETTKISTTCDGPNDDTQSQRKDVKVDVINAEPIGLFREHTSSHAIKVNDSEVSITIPLPKPANLEPDTFMVSIAVTGSQLLLPMQNLENLLNMPSSCCEQQPHLLITISCIAERMEEMNLLDNATRARVMLRLSNGYMDLLSCSSNFGPFNRFRNGQFPSSWVDMWSLGALVKIAKFIYIDNTMKNQIVDRLAASQDLKTGCMLPDGTSPSQTPNDTMIQFTAEAVTILTNLATEISTVQALIDLAWKCLGSGGFQQLDISTQIAIILAYAVTGQQSKVQALLPIVLAHLTTKDGRTYIKDKIPWLVQDQYSYGLSPNELINTANLLSIMTTDPNPSQERKDLMAAIATTLSSQMNAGGGFRTAKDTAATWCGLTIYDKLYGTRETNANFTLLLGNNVVATFSIPNNKKYQLFTRKIPPIPGNYICKVKGKGSLFVQLGVQYNMQVNEGANSQFAMTVTTEADCSTVAPPMIRTNITLRYIGNKNEIGTTVVQFSLMSGYYVYSPGQYTGSSGICEAEIKNGRLLLYMDNVPKNESKVSIVMYRLQRVERPQRSRMVTTAMSGESSTITYGHPCPNVIA